MYLNNMTEQQQKQKKQEASEMRLRLYLTAVVIVVLIVAYVVAGQEIPPYIIGLVGLLLGAESAIKAVLGMNKK